MFGKDKKEVMPTHICTTCGTECTPVHMRRGNGFLELILWLSFIIPGILYTAWRNIEDELACKQCGGITIIPLSTPMGRKLHAELEVYNEVSRVVA